MEISLEILLFFITGLVIGGLIAFALAKHPSSRTLPVSATEKLQLTPNTFTLSGVDGIHSIELNRDSQGRLTGIRMAFQSEAATSPKAAAGPETGRDPSGAESPQPPKSLRIESIDDSEPVHFPRTGKKGAAVPIPGTGMRKMEQVRQLKLSLHMETDKRTVNKEFSNLFDLKWFLDSFFSWRADRRSGKPRTAYAGPERRTKNEAPSKVRRLC